MDDVGFTDKVFSAAKIASVVDKLTSDGAAPVDALADAEVRSFGSELASSSDLQEPADPVLSKRDRAIAGSHLAYAIGSSVHLSAYGMYGYAMLCSTNFRSTMDFAVRYRQMATPLVTIAFEERDGLGIWTIEPLTHPKIDSRLYRFVAELQIATHISLHRDIMGEGFKPARFYWLSAGRGLPYPECECRLSGNIRAPRQSNSVRTRHILMLRRSLAIARPILPRLRSATLCLRTSRCG